MDELALRILLNSLEASRSSLHGLLHIFTGFVVVGLGFDLFVIIKEFRDDWGEFRYGQIHPYENRLPKQPSASLLILALLGTALIVIGVAGELYVDVRAGKIETQIRVANDKLLGLIIQQAGDAKTSAIGAASAASQAQQDARQLRTDLNDARVKLEAAQIRLEKEQQKTFEAQKEAANAQLALKGYVEKVAGQAISRRLDNDVFVKGLKGKPKGSVRIWYKPEDDEAYMFAQQVYRWLGTSLESGGAGWEVSEPVRTPPTVIPHISKPFVSIMPANISTPSLKNPPSLYDFQVNFPEEYTPNAPPDARFAGIGGSGLTLLCHPGEQDPAKGTAVMALAHALTDSVRAVVVVQGELSLPDGVIIVVVGQRR
jgi:hypothetical protein